MLSVSGVIVMRFRLIIPFLLIASSVMAQSFVPRALDLTAVTVSSTAVTALTGPANGCNISSSSALIIDPVATAGTSASGTSQLQPANAAPYQCGVLAAGVKVSVNCSGGGTCAWTGVRW